MKRKVLSKEALEALAQVRVEAATEVEVDVLEAGATEEKTDVEPTAEGTVASDAVPVDPEAIRAEVSAEFTEQIATLTAEHTKALDAAKVEFDRAAKAKEGFREIVASQINVMRTALFLTDVDLSAMSDDSVLREYDAVTTTFEKSLPVGGVVPKEAETKKEEIRFTNKDAGAVDALGF